MSGGMRDIKKLIVQVIKEKKKERLLELQAIPVRKVVNPLISLLCSTDSEVKWNAVTLLGTLVAQLAEQDMESARVIMRRFMWQLNDESGGIGWGIPEAMAEVMAHSQQLAAEYARILVSYIREDGNYIEHPDLQQGVLWGIGRLAEVNPESVKEAAPFLEPFLQSLNPLIRGLAARAASALNPPKRKYDESE